MFVRGFGSVKSLKFSEWLERAHEADLVGIEPSEEHWYAMCGVEAGRILHKIPGKMQFIPKDLPSFSTTKKNFFVTKVRYCFDWAEDGKAILFQAHRSISSTRKKCLSFRKGQLLLYLVLC